MIRGNSVHPTSVNTDMVHNQATYAIFRTDPPAGSVTREDGDQSFRTSLNLLPITWVEPVDISNALVWLCSDMARYVTGVQLPMDAGNAIKP
jgi:NAD(P)-dependent dehydrogenase (short-subunit alcohol dehydrogenase family)